MSGTFKDAGAFNKAFVSMKKLEDKIKSRDDEAQALSQNLSIDKLYNLTSLTWDGSVMTRTVEPNNDIEPESEMDNLRKGNNKIVNV